jgi:hypothetical protein
MYQVLHGQEQQTPNGVVVHLIDDDGHPVTVEVFGNVHHQVQVNITTWPDCDDELAFEVDGVPMDIEPIGG